MNKKILSLLEKFLEKRIKIEPGYEDAKATSDEAREFEDLMEAILDAKYQKSYRGNVPLSLYVVNRSTHEVFTSRRFLTAEMEKMT